MQSSFPRGKQRWGHSKPKLLEVRPLGVSGAIGEETWLGAIVIATDIVPLPFDLDTKGPYTVERDFPGSIADTAAQERTKNLVESSGDHQSLRLWYPQLALPLKSELATAGHTAESTTVVVSAIVAGS